MECFNVWLKKDTFLQPQNHYASKERNWIKKSNALKVFGISDVIMISGQSFDRFGNNTFDFAFFGLRISLDFVLVDQPFEIASEVCRILRYGGLTTFRDVKGLYSTSSMYEVVLRKSLEDSISDDIAQRCDNNTVPEYKRDLIGDLEPLEEKEPLEDWTEQGKHSESIKLFRHLPTMVDLIYKRMYIYIDLGARTYNSMIGNWFEKLYPKQSKRFEIFTIEADKSFHEYKRKKDVTLLPYPAWIRNETLVFGTRNKKREYTAGFNQDSHKFCRTTWGSKMLYKPLISQIG
nr:uncharacterized protein LOC113722682 [Coffea arabica]